MKEKVCFRCTFSEEYEPTRDNFLHCTVHDAAVYFDEDCRFFAEMPEFEENPELDECRDAPSEEDVLYYQL